MTFRTGRVWGPGVGTVKNEVQSFGKMFLFVCPSIRGVCVCVFYGCACVCFAHGPGQVADSETNATTPLWIAQQTATQAAEVTPATTTGKKRHDVRRSINIMRPPHRTLAILSHHRMHPPPSASYDSFPRHARTRVHTHARARTHVHTHTHAIHSLT